MEGILWLVTLTNVLTNPQWVHYQWRRRFIFLIGANRIWNLRGSDFSRLSFSFSYVKLKICHGRGKLASSISRRCDNDASASSTCQESNYANLTHTRVCLFDSITSSIPIDGSVFKIISSFTSTANFPLLKSRATIKYSNYIEIFKLLNTWNVAASF